MKTLLGGLCGARVVVLKQSELYVSDVQDGDHNVEDLRNFWVRKVHVLHALEGHLKVSCVVDVVNGEHVTLVNVVIVF